MASVHTAFTINKGVNIGNWLEGNNTNIEINKLSTIFGVVDVDSIVSYGFDHIRLPISEKMILKDNGKINRNLIKLVHFVIKQCEKRNLKVILDLHDVNNHYINNLGWGVEREKANLIRIWETLLNEMEKYPEEILAYELLNKPNMRTDEQWNDISYAIIQHIRKRNKKRVIVLGSNNNNSVENISNIDVSRLDSNIIVCFHFYEPSLLTKYRAAYTDFGKLKFKNRMTYPGFLVSDENYNELTNIERELVNSYRKVYNRGTIKSRIKSAAVFAKKKGIKLYLSEFGCLPNNGGETQIAWIRDVISVCREFNIAYCLWEYNSGFGFVDRKTRQIKNRKLLNILTK